MGIWFGENSNLQHCKKILVAPFVISKLCQIPRQINARSGTMRGFEVRACGHINSLTGQYAYLSQSRCAHCNGNGLAGMPASKQRTEWWENQSDRQRLGGVMRFLSKANKSGNLEYGFALSDWTIGVKISWTNGIIIQAEFLCFWISYWLDDCC